MNFLSKIGLRRAEYMPFVSKFFDLYGGFAKK